MEQSINPSVQNNQPQTVQGQDESFVRSTDAGYDSLHGAGANSANASGFHSQPLHNDTEAPSQEDIEVEAGRSNHLRHFGVQAKDRKSARALATFNQAERGVQLGEMYRYSCPEVNRHGYL
ncbi:MAG: internal scaffolding protein [Microviridae sp.]|nr:MAG: internal scaffolding protein [Microviridae sp.]